MRLLFSLGMATLLLAASTASAQTDSLLTQRQAPLQLRQIDSSQMSPVNHAAVAGSWSLLEQQAKFFGYNLSDSGWHYVQIESPDTPDYVMLQFHRPHATATGASAFTALVSRQGSKVWVVPVLYGGAIPWKSASSMKYTREVFNRVVPPTVAKESIRPSGNWPQLGLTFTSLAGDDAVVLSAPAKDLKWIKAPGATLIVATGQPYRIIELSDVHLQGSYRVWDLAFDAGGRLVRVHITTYADTKAIRVPTQPPPGKMLPNLPKPQGKIVHPTPIPQ